MTQVCELRGSYRCNPHNLSLCQCEHNHLRQQNNATDDTLAARGVSPLPLSVTLWLLGVSALHYCQCE